MRINKSLIKAQESELETRKNETEQTLIDKTEVAFAEVSAINAEQMIHVSQNMVTAHLELDPYVMSDLSDRIKPLDVMCSKGERKVYKGVHGNSCTRNDAFASLQNALDFRREWNRKPGSEVYSEPDKYGCLPEYIEETCEEI